MQANIKSSKVRRYDAKKIIKEIYVYVILLLVIVALSYSKPDVEWFQRGHFLFPGSITNLLRISAPVIMISSAFTFIFISGNIDLSVGSTLSLTTVFYAILVLNGLGFFPALLVTIILGVVLGGINGWLVMKLRITPVIATLITMSAYQGIARYLVPEGISAIKSNDAAKMPEWMGNFSRNEVFIGLSWAFLAAMALVIVLVILQKRTVYGKYISAIGGNRTAAELSGINAVKVVWGTYILLGAVAALAGVARGSYLMIGEPYTGIGVETEAIIACLLGGTVFTGGEGSVVKSVIGALIIVCLTLGLQNLGAIPPYWQLLLKGIVLVFAVALNRVLTIEKVAA
jgi:ribose/xylose/arabinose/galactoside ABC-type transport system permease subunit